MNAPTSLRLALVPLLLGCVGSPGRVAERGVAHPGVPPVRPVTVSLRVEGRPGAEGRPRVLEVDQALRGGDQIAMRVEVDQPAYVYVAQVTPDGRPEVLFPQTGDRQVSPGEPVRLPEPGKWFAVEDAIGQESVYVVASTQPIGQADQALCAQLQLPCGRQAFAAADKAPPPPPPPPPGNVDITTRGQQLGAADRTLRARTDQGGVAILRFTFRHAK